MAMAISRRFFIPLCTSATIAVASGLSHGWLDGRWVDKPDVEAIGAKLKDLPEQLGEWSLVENQELPKAAISILQCYGHSLNVYRNSKTGSRLSVALLFGPRGPIAVHTPEVCYSGVGIEQSGKTEMEVIRVDEEVHTFWRVNLLSKPALKPALEAYYAWSDGGNWQAADYPRVWLTGELYKIQLACSPTEPGQSPDAIQFLQLFLPKIQPLLVKTK